MTEAQARWLRELRDVGPLQRWGQFHQITSQVRGWVQVARFETGAMSRRHLSTHIITPTGLAALAEYEEKRK